MSILIDAVTLAQWQEDKEQSLVIIDVRYSLQSPEEGRRAYHQGHIPGARYVSLSHDLSCEVIPGKTSRHPLPEPEAFIETLQSWGITKESRVVLYDSGDQFIVPRLWWMLAVWFDVPNVFILHGGVRVWSEAGYKLDTAVPAPQKTDYVPAVNRDVLVQADQVLPFVESGGTLLDARGYERFAGEVEPIDPVAGHIPGAKCQPCSQNVDGGGMLLPVSQLQELYAPYAGKDVICYCGSGVSACQNILAMTLAGMSMPRLYAGSWSEWVADPSRPVATGV